MSGCSQSAAQSFAGAAALALAALIYTWTVFRVWSDTGFYCPGWRSLVPAWQQAGSLIVVTCARVCCANKVS